MFEKSNTKGNGIIQEGKPTLANLYEEKENDTIGNNSEKTESRPSVLHLLAINGNRTQLSEYLRNKKEEVDEHDNMGRTPLIYSVLGDRVDCVLVLLKAGADINKADVDKRTALHWAAYQGDHKLVKLLISHNADRVARDKEGRTALHLSTSHNNIKVLQVLVRSMEEHELDTPDNKKMTALAWSVFYDRIDYVILLLKHGANPGSIDNEKRTVLHWTSENKDTTIIKMLIDRDPLICNWNDCEGRTALHMAVGQSNHNLVEFLLSVPSIEVNCIDHMHRTPLHWAAVLGNKLLAALLLDHGADHTLGDNNGVRALHYAAQNDAHEVVHIMISKKGVKDIPDDKQGTALMWAAVKGCDNVVRTLLKSGCSDPNAVDIHGQTALHMCTQAGHLNCIKLLIDNGANVGIVDEKHHIPLFYACASGRAEIVTELLSHGSSSNLDDRDLEGRCPLHYAAMVDRTDIIKVLIQNNLNPNTKDNAGCPPLHFASYGGFVNCMSVLLENGANVNIQDNDGCTALHWACRSGSLDAVKLLVSRYGAKVSPFESSSEQLTPLDFAILEDHQDVRFYLRENNAHTAVSLKHLSATKIQAVWRGYKFRRYYQENRYLFLKHEMMRRAISAAEDSNRSNKVPINHNLLTVQPLQTYSNIGNLQENCFMYGAAGYHDAYLVPAYMQSNHCKRSTASNVSGHTVSSRSSVFHPVDRSHGDLRYGPTLNLDDNSQIPLHKMSVGPLASYNVLQKHSCEDVMFKRKMSTGSLPAVQGGFVTNDNRVRSSSSNVGDRQSMKSHRNAKSVNNMNVRKDDSHDRRLRSPQVTNMNHFAPYSIRSSHSSMTPVSSDVHGNIFQPKDKNNWYNKTYSRYESPEQQGSLISTSSESSALFETKPLNHVLSTILQQKKNKGTESSATSSIDVDLSPKHVMYNDFRPKKMFPTDANQDKPWNVYRRDKKRINMIRLKTEAAIAIQRAFRKYAARKDVKRRSSPKCSHDKENVGSIDTFYKQHLEAGGSEQQDVMLESDHGRSDEEGEEDDEFTLQEVAALVIQLAWRQYIKNKLVSSQHSNYNSCDDEQIPMSSADEGSINKQLLSRLQDSDDFDSSYDERTIRENHGNIYQGKKKLTMSHSLPALENIYSKNVTRKRSSKFSLKKRLLQRNAASTNNSTVLVSMQQPLSKSDISAIKAGKPKLILQG